MVDLEYRIGKLDPNNPIATSKFIVSCEDAKTMDIYAREYVNGLEHAHIARFFALGEGNIRGGGLYTLTGGELIVNDYSQMYGSLPVDVAENVGRVLAEHFRSTGMDVQKITVSMLPGFVNRQNVEFWKSLGFDVKYT